MDMPQDTEILIIGGGVIGLSIARELKKRGVSGITVLEKGTCGEESSWAAAGMLGPQADTDVAGDMLRFCVGSRELYAGFAESLLADTGIDIELDREGTIFLAFNEDDTKLLDGRCHWQKAAGLRAESMTGPEVRRAEPFVSPDVIGGVLFPDDWQVDNRKLCDALRRYVELNGIRIFENTEATGLVNENGRVTGARTSTGDIRAAVTVVATGAWASLIKLGAFQLPVNIRPIRGQIICYHTAKRLFDHVLYSSRGYLVPRADGYILSGATSEDVGFVKATTDAGIASLKESAEAISPSLAGLEIVDQCSGLRPRAPDGLPVLGSFAGLDSLFIATGHYRNGILLAPVTGEIMADAIVTGRRSEFLTVFGPDRFRAANVSV
jgi:glycine oxidase